MVVSNFSSKNIGVLLGNGNGTFQAPQNYTTDAGPFGLGIGDFDGDGKLDLASANNSNSLSVLLGNGDGTFKPPQNYEEGSSPSSIAVGDFNGDGKLDLAASNRATSTISVLLK